MGREEKMSAAINDYIKNEIIEIYERVKNIDNFFISKQIPPKKLKKAISSYASSISHDEAVIFLFDDTVFGSAKEGFILTSKRLYYKNIVEKGNSIAVANILDLTMKREKLNSHFIVRTDSDELDIHITQAQKQNANALFNVLDKTVGLLKNTNPASAVSIGQTSWSPICRGCGANNPGNVTRCEYCDSPL